MNHRHTLVLAGLLGALGVLAGAFGAHALRPQLSALAMATYQTGVLYHLLHALALAALAAIQARQDSRPLRLAVAALALGTLLFSGSLYALALGGPRWLGPVTPLGGSLFILGWLALSAHALRRPNRN